MNEKLKFEIINDGKTLRVSAENPEDFAQFIKDHEDDALTSFTPNSDKAFMELTESYSCNGWLITTADNLGHMSECLVISNDYFDEGDDIDFESGEFSENIQVNKMWTNIHNYQIVSPLYCILEDGYYDFFLAE